MRRLFLAGLSVVMLSGCETTYKQVPTITAAEGTSAVRFSHGSALVMSDGLYGTVWLRPVRYFSGDKIFFQVIAFNHTKDPVNFGTEDIEMRTGSGEPLPVYDFDALQHSARKKAQDELVGATVVEGLNAWHAERVSRRNPEVGVRIMRSGANDYFATVDAVNASLEDALITYSLVTLQTTTVDPYTSFGGVVFSPNIGVSDGIREIVTNVRFAGEDHLFRLRIAPEGTPTPIQRGLPAVRRERVESQQHSPNTWLWDHPH
jgi:hypothetical protein